MDKRVETFHDLVVWQKSHELSLEVYKVTAKFPKREQTMLARQQRQAVALIPTNIAIGFKKRGKKTKVHYYLTALTSIEHIRYFLILSRDLDYVKDVDPLVEMCDIIEKMLKRLIRSIASG